jgi:hypothetical protein
MCTRQLLYVVCAIATRRATILHGMLFATSLLRKLAHGMSRRAMLLGKYFPIFNPLMVSTNRHTFLGLKIADPFQRLVPNAHGKNVARFMLALRL